MLLSFHAWNTQCNSILYGLPKLAHDKLQRIQNIAARLITGTKWKEHITPTLKDLHFLAVTESCIVFKIPLLTYLTSLFNAYKPFRSLRSSGQSLLQVPDMKTCTYGQRSFSFTPRNFGTTYLFISNSLRA